MCWAATNTNKHHWLIKLTKKLFVKEVFITLIFVIIIRYATNYGVSVIVSN